MESDRHKTLQNALYLVLGAIVVLIVAIAIGLSTKAVSVSIARDMAAIGMPILCMLAVVIITRT